MRTILFIVISTLLLAAPLAATMAIRAGEAPPTDAMLGFDAPAGGSYVLRRGVGAEVGVGQTFHLTEPAVLESITLMIEPETEIGGEEATLWIGTFSGPEDDAMNAILATESGFLPTTLEVGQTVYLTFDVEDRALEAGVQYGFMLRFTTGNGGTENRAKVFHLGSDAYPGGRPLQLEGTYWDGLWDDLVFFLGGESEGDDGAEILELGGGRFEVTVAWRAPDGQQGRGQPVNLTDDSGYFWFFGPDNTEVVVKVLDACFEPFMHYWVFAAGMTDVEVELTVRDTAADVERVYRRPMGEAFQPVRDTAAFATCESGT